MEQYYANKHKQPKSLLFQPMFFCISHTYALQQKGGLRTISFLKPCPETGYWNQNRFIHFLKPSLTSRRPPGRCLWSGRRRPSGWCSWCSCRGATSSGWRTGSSCERTQWWTTHTHTHTVRKTNRDTLRAKPSASSGATTRPHSRRSLCSPQNRHAKFNGQH